MKSFSQQVMMVAVTAVLLAVGGLVPSGTSAQSAAGTHAAEGRHSATMADHMHGFASPSQPGQGAFGAIQEIVAILDADPATDWSKVDLEALRQHLIDMNELVLHSSADERVIDGGLDILVTGEGRTLDAIRRMVPAHAQEIDGLDGWRAEAALTADGVRLTVTSDEAAEIARIRGLGYIGIMASGSHHQAHHLMMARGEMQH
jgi:hypothetical protein